MSIFLGALSGLGEAAVDIGKRSQIAQLQEEQDARRVKSDTDLATLRANLEEQKAINLEKFKHDQGLQEKSRIGGIVSGAMKAKQDEIDAGMDPFGPNPSSEEISRAVRNSPREALLNSGDLEAAKAYGSAQEQGQFSLGYGQTRFDSEGKPIADNAAEVRAQAALQNLAAKQQIAQAAQDRAANRGKLQPLDQTELGKVNEQIGKYVKNQFSAVKNPFAPLGSEDTTDSAKQSLATSYLSATANEAGKRGIAINVPDTMKKMMPILNSYDSAITAQANKTGDEIFDEKGKPIPDRVDMWKNAGYPASVLTNKTSFQDYYRNKALQDDGRFEVYADAMARKAQQGGGQSMSKPVAAPEKSAGIASNAAQVDSGNAGGGLFGNVASAFTGSPINKPKSNDEIWASDRILQNFDSEIQKAMQKARIDPSAQKDVDLLNKQRTAYFSNKYQY